MYDLCVDGVNAFYQRRPGSKQIVRREPLVGVVDGVNTVFLSSHRPFLYDSLRLYAVNAPTTPLLTTEVDAEGGVIIFGAAPTKQVVADYTAVPMTLRQIAYFAWAGFDLMETIWPRGYRLSTDPVTYAAADPDSAAIYVVSVNGTAASDPVTGSRTFSASEVQRAFLSRCIEMAYLDSLAFESAARDLDIRERSGGIGVNASRRPSNLRDLKTLVWNELERSWYAAMDEFYPNGDHYGMAVDLPHTAEYEEIWHWQANDNGLLMPYGINL